MLFPHFTDDHKTLLAVTPFADWLNVNFPNWQQDAKTGQPRITEEHGKELFAGVYNDVGVLLVGFFAPNELTSEFVNSFNFYAHYIQCLYIEWLETTDNWSNIRYDD